MSNNNILEIKNLNVDYISSTLGKKHMIRAVDNLSLEVKKGEILAIAGESGCGKSTLSKSIIHLVKPTSGEIVYDNENIYSLNKHQLKVFKQKVQMVFQNPYASLNPKMTIKEILFEPLIINSKLAKKEIERIVVDKIKQVGLDEYHLQFYPHEFSGGQRQRIAIARALVLNPEFIIADEPVSALDASIQAQIINLIKDLQMKYQITMMFISHDLNVIKYIADRVGIMYLGELVEIGTRDEIFNNPQHPYTRLLLYSIPNINKKTASVNLSELPTVLPEGCKFYTRCPNQMCHCRIDKPTYRSMSETHKVLCVYN